MIDSAVEGDCFIKANGKFHRMMVCPENFLYLLKKTDHQESTINSQEREIHALLDRIEDLKRELQEARK